MSPLKLKIINLEAIQEPIIQLGPKKLCQWLIEDDMSHIEIHNTTLWLLANVSQRCNESVEPLRWEQHAEHVFRYRYTRINGK